MSGWWDDFSTLLFKRAVLLKEQAAETVGRYLAFLRRATITLLKPLGVLLLVFLLCVALGIQAAWVYQTLLLLVAGVLLTIVFLALPLLVLVETAYNLLPESLQKTVRVWQRRGAAILFGALLAVALIKVFRLWQSPGTMFNALLILSVLWIGGYFGWLQVSGAWRTFLAAKLQLSLIFIVVMALFPGPAGLVEELVGWAGERLETSVFRVTRPTPQRWQPASADELRFVDEGTGKFLVWYYRDKQGNYELFTSKGYDRSGKPLKLAQTEKEFTAIHEWQRARDQEREMARRAQEDEARRRVIADFEHRMARARGFIEQRAFDGAEREVRDARNTMVPSRALLGDAEVGRMDTAADQLLSTVKLVRAEHHDRLRLRSYVTALPKARVNFIVFFVDFEGKLSQGATSAVAQRLARRESVSAVGDVLSDAFASPRGFDAVVAGKGGADVVAMQLGDAADRLLLIRGSDQRSAPSATVSGLRTYSMKITVSLIDARDGSKLREFAINDITGAGVNETAAKAACIERFAEILATRDELLTGLQRP